MGDLLPSRSICDMHEVISGGAYQILLQVQLLDGGRAYYVVKLRVLEGGTPIFSSHDVAGLLASLVGFSARLSQNSS